MTSPGLISNPPGAAVALGSLAVASHSQFVAPRTQAEQLLAEIWKELLCVKEVGVHDDFFELGGHSLLATQVVSRVNQTTHAGLSLPMIFMHPTLEALAAALKPNGHSRSESVVPEIKAVARENRRVWRPANTQKT